MPELTPYQKGYCAGFYGWTRDNPYSKAADWKRWRQWNRGKAVGKKHHRENVVIPTTPPQKDTTQ